MKENLMSKARAMWLAALIAGLAMLLAPGTSEAGKPVYKNASEETSDLNHAKVVDDSAVVYNYYAELAPGKQDIYQVYAGQGEAINPRLWVPRSDDLKDFTPSLAIIGPGITSSVTADQLAALPVKPPTTTGVLIATFGGTGGGGTGAGRKEVSDPILMATYWEDQHLDLAYPQDGPFYLVVWDPNKRGGKYVLTIGGQEDFGLFDLIKYPYTWAKLELWHGNWLAVLIATIVLVALVYFVVRGLRKRRKSNA
jgi:hypothetical protein